MTKMTTKFALLVALTMPLGASTAIAGSHGHKSQQHTKSHHSDRTAAVQSTLQKREAYLRASLSLSAPTAERLFPLLASFTARESKLNEDIHQARKQLKTRDASDLQINRALDAMARARAQKNQLVRQRTRAIRKLLSPRQAAKLIGVLPHLDYKMKHAHKSKYKSKKKNRAVRHPQRPSNKRWGWRSHRG